MSKIAVVTGSAKGIGADIVKKLCRDGYSVTINYNKSAAEANILCESLLKQGFSVNIFKADVSVFEEANNMFAFVNRTFGDIDVLVNNAGVSDYRLFNDCTSNEWDSIIKSNVNTLLNCSRLALDVMLKRHTGSIVNISSVWGMVGASMEVIYSMTKAAVIGFTKALAKEVAPNNIRVNCVAPGVINTDMMKDFSDNDIEELKNITPLGTIGKVEDVSETVSFLVSDKAKFITGQVISPNGGFVI